MNVKKQKHHFSDHDHHHHHHHWNSTGKLNNRNSHLKSVLLDTWKQTRKRMIKKPYMDTVTVND
jgi:hypothetical protein